MRKFAFVPGIAIAAALFVAPTQAAGPGDSIHGGGFISPPASCPSHFAVNARSGPAGEDPDGRLHYASASGTATCPKSAFFNADVVCLRVDGNQATLLAGLDKTKNGPPRFEGGGFMAFYEDNGNPKGGEPLDRQQNTRLTPEQFAVQQALGCPPPIEPRTTLIHGNIHIRDN